MKAYNTPKTQGDLLKLVQSLLGQSLSDVARCIGYDLPVNLSSNKGCIGQLLEAYLGTDAGNESIPDFQHLGIELKTMPIGQSGLPQESTFVCSINFKSIHHETWLSSHVYHKLRHILWIPIEADKDIPLAQRRIGQGFLWRPSEHELSVLEKDWQELVDLIVMGQLTTIHAGFGTYLQVRPKAATGKTLKATGSIGADAYSLPRGFYLRRTFIKKIYETVIIGAAGGGILS